MLSVVSEDGQLKVERPNEEKRSRELHGLTRTLINNMVVGVTQGYEKTLLIEGVGYRAQVKGKVLDLQLQFSHPVEYPIPDGITINCPSNTEIEVSGIDKQVVGQVAANIRAIRKPEPLPRAIVEVGARIGADGASLQPLDLLGNGLLDELLR